MGALWMLCALCVSYCYGSPAPAQYDTVVVGMGAAGTAAGAALAAAGRRVLGLEAQPRLGGRVHTVPWGDSTVELGAEWIHGITGSSTYELAVKHNITILNQEGPFRVYFSDGSTQRGDIVEDLTKYTMELMENPPKTPEPMGQYITRSVLNYTTTRYPSVADDTDFTRSVLEFLDQFTLTFESANSWDDISTHTSFVELDGNNSMSWHTYGYRTLFDLLLNTYKNGPGYPSLEMKLATEVTHIQWPQDPADNVVVTTKDGATYTARNVIVTVSLGVLKERYKTLFSPPLPPQKVRPIEAISFGVCAKIIFRFPHEWWPHDSLGCFVWKQADKASVSEEDQWLLRVNMPGPPMSAKNTLSTWVCGDAAKKVETLPDEEVKTKVMGLMRRFMGSNNTVPEPVEMIKSSWYSNPFIRGAYTYDNVESPKYPGARADLAAPLVDSAGEPRVLFAGEATNTQRFATVHGAVDSGRREANRLLSAAATNAVTSSTATSNSDTS